MPDIAFQYKIPQKAFIRNTAFEVITIDSNSVSNLNAPDRRRGSGRLIRN